MAYDPDSRALELSYMDFRPTTDVNRIALGERVDIRAQDMEVESSTIALTKLITEDLTRLYGRALNPIRAALRTLVQERHREEEKNTTKEEWEERKARIIGSVSPFNQEIIQKAQKIIEEESGDQEEESNIDFDRDFHESSGDATHSDEIDSQAEPEEDAEDHFRYQWRNGKLTRCLTKFARSLVLPRTG
ncbi:hypothetical protein GGR57DRAFT_500092 [Xylariaceae sp. FL1272]|nr:hypothetical protein GGR57DRAFT_500092 [Xylariaceae sp. FL1272]